MKGSDYFVSKMFRRMVVPSLTASLGFAFSDVADSLVVGTRLGETGLAAISLCLPVFMIINFIMDGIGKGGSVRFSKLIGGGKAEKACECFNRIWITALFAGISFGVVVNAAAPLIIRLLGASAGDGGIYHAGMVYMRIIAAGSPLLMLNIIFADFLRNDNNAEIASAGFLAGSITDIVLNIIFVLVFRMGIAGAALATVIGSAVAICCYMPGYLSKEANIIKFSFVHYDIHEVWSCCKTGFSDSVQNLFQLVFFLVINNLLMNIGGEGAVAVFDVMYGASLFIIYMYTGTSEAMQPLISVFTGERNIKDCISVLNQAKKIGIAAGGIVAVLIFVLAEKIAIVFGISDENLDIGILALRVYCTGFVFLGVNIIFEKYHQAREESEFSFLITVLRNFVILIPCVFLFSYFGEKVIWFAFPVTELISLLIFILFRHRIKKDEYSAEKTLQLTLKKDGAEFESALEKIEQFCSENGASEKQKYYARLVIEELCMSIIRNALVNIDGGRIRVTLNSEENGEFTIRFIDNAVVFNPFSKHAAKVDMDRDFDIDAVSMSIIRRGTKEFMYRRTQGFNSLVVRL